MTDRFPGLATQPDIRTLYISDQAADSIKKMFARCELIKDRLGVGTEYVEAVSSLHHCLTALLRKGFGAEAYVCRDMDFNSHGLNLIIQEGQGFMSGIT